MARGLLDRWVMPSRSHDALFKAAFEVPAYAEALFRAVLPASVFDVLDWTKLRRESASFIDHELGDLHGDHLFSIPRRDGSGRALIYLLAEHQSTPDPAMPLRLLDYLVEIWKRERKTHPGEPLPVIIPVVISHAPGGWTAPISLFELFTPESAEVAAGLSAYIPQFRVIVEDLSVLSNEEIRARLPTPIPRLVWWALRDARDPARLLANIAAWADMLDAAARTHEATLVQILSYLARITDQRHDEVFRAKLFEHAPTAGEAMPTIADKWHNEGLTIGLTKGREEGREEGRKEALRALLVAKFGSISPELEERIARAMPAELGRFLERVLVSDSLAGVFTEPT